MRHFWYLASSHNAYVIHCLGKRLLSLILATGARPRRAIVAVAVLVLVFGGCTSDPDPRLEEDRPPELLDIADQVEENPFSEVVDGAGLRPLPATHRFFEGRRGYNLGVTVAFDDPARDAELHFHFDQTEAGAQKQFEELRMALEGGMLPGSNRHRFCSATGAWVECVALEGTYVVAADAKDEVRFVQRLVDVGLTYAQEVSR